MVEAAGVGAATVDERSEEMVEAAGVEPASGSAPTRDSTGLVRLEVSPPPWKSNETGED
jgi:hypothetical protein